MNKPQKPQVTGPQTPPAFRLDEKITQLIADFAKLLKKIWLPLALVLAVCLFGYLIYELVGFIHSSKEEGLVDRLFTLVESRDARDARDASVSDQGPAIDQLVKDSKGSDSERYILKEAVGYLQSKISSKRPDLSRDPDEDPGKSPAPGDSQDTSRIMEKIEEYARLGQETFPRDEDMQAWSSNVLAWIKTEKEFKSRSMEKRSFAPVLPGTAPPAPPAPTAPPQEKAATEAPPPPSTPPGEPAKAEPVPAAQRAAPEKAPVPAPPQPTAPAPQAGPSTSGGTSDAGK